MKKIIVLLIIVLIVIFASSCNRQMVDLTYRYDRAIIELPNGEVIEGDVESWRDYADGDQIQVKIDGVQYLVHSSDIVLISD